MPGDCPVDYHGSADQNEWVTDVVFRSPQRLAALYPQVLQHAITHFGSQDVLCVWKSNGTFGCGRRLLQESFDQVDLAVPSVRYVLTAKL